MLSDEDCSEDIIAGSSCMESPWPMVISSLKW